MREILFRAKRIDGKEWVEGYFVSLNDCPVIVLKEAAERFSIEMKRMLKSHDMIMVVPETVCQYTGLTDKNGRKIFEGYIVRLPKCENDIAVFSKKGCNYFLKGKRSSYELGSCDSECFEVIGNIFDNPELIGEQP